MGRVALITGASGFVGGHLAERLAAAGWHLRALVRPASDTALLRALGAELVEGDLAAPAAIARAAAGADTVFHLAAVTAARDEAAYHLVNAQGTRHVVEGALLAAPRPRRIVYLSSYAACGPAADGRPRRLDDPPAPLTAYGRTKLAGEHALAAARDAGMETVTLRAPAVYGPRGRELLPYFRLVARRLAPAPGGPPRRLHLVYAPDLAAALERAADAPPGTYPVAEPVEHPWSAVVAEMARALGTRPLRLALPPALVRAAAAATEWAGAAAGRPVAFNREKAEEMLAPHWVCDLSASGAVLPPGEATPLAEGLARTAQWYRTTGWL
jgi:nucleoside-diphosphate-sugar epimerase